MPSEKAQTNSSCAPVVLKVSQVYHCHLLESLSSQRRQAAHWKPRLFRPMDEQKGEDPAEQREPNASEEPCPWEPEENMEPTGLTRSEATDCVRQFMKWKNVDNYAAYYCKDTRYGGLNLFQYAMTHFGLQQETKFMILSSALTRVPSLGGITPLQLACTDLCSSESFLEMMLIMDDDLDVNAPGDVGTPPLHYTIEDQCFEALDTLLKYGADVLQRADNGETAFHVMARRRTRGDIVKKLFQQVPENEEYDVFWSHKNAEGKTPAMLAIASQAWKVWDLALQVHRKEHGRDDFKLWDHVSDFLLDEWDFRSPSEDAVPFFEAMPPMPWGIWWWLHTDDAVTQLKDILDRFEEAVEETGYSRLLPRVSTPAMMCLYRLHKTWKEDGFPTSTTRKIHEALRRMFDGCTEEYDFHEDNFYDSDSSSQESN